MRWVLLGMPAGSEGKCRGRNDGTDDSGREEEGGSENMGGVEGQKWLRSTVKTLAGQEMVGRRGLKG
jgi:hypothetical protein